MEFHKKNLFIYVYIFFAIGLELFAQLFVGAHFYIVQFWLPLMIIAIIVLLLFFIPEIIIKDIVAMVLLGIQAIVLLAGNFLYRANGTAFQNEMLNQRNDAFGTMEKLDINIGLVMICLIACAIVIQFGIFHIKIYKQKWQSEKAAVRNPWHFAYLAISILLLVVFCTMPIIDSLAGRARSNYHHKLEVYGDGNQMRGVTTNFLYEMLKFSNDIDLSNLDSVDEFIYAEPALTSEYFGISQDNNLLMILAESLDTHVLDAYAGETSEVDGRLINDILFPNLTYLMGDGLNFTNFRAKEKTDTAEVFSLLGNYPTQRYINYDFPNNSYPFALPKLFKDINPDAQVNYFHQNRIEFYNRDTLMKSAGFEETYGVDEMNAEPYNMGGKKTTTAGGWNKVDRNLDSRTIDVMKDVMFPSDQQFFTYWTTFVSHGFYRDRVTLSPYYEIFDQHNVFQRGTKMENVWRNYAATIMDFDKALGMIITDLKEKGVFDKTTIVIVSDHDTYYNNLSMYAGKELGQVSGRFDSNRFRIPFIIHDKTLQERFRSDFGTTDIDRFVTSGDIVPTLLDIFGIKGWRNLYLGSSVFAGAEESISYSRVYHYFFNDLMLFYTKRNVLWKDGDFTSEAFNSFIGRAEAHLDKLEVIDQIYFSDYFNNNEYRVPA